MADEIKIIVTQTKKPKYYLRESFNYNEWWVICQKSNNVIVAEIPERPIAELVLEFLNTLPGSMVKQVKI